MKIWHDNKNNNGTTSSSTEAVAYSKVQLVDGSQPVDLFIYNVKRGKQRLWSCCLQHEAWLEEGRPRELSSLPLATWSLLTTSVKEYQRGLRELNLRILRRILLPAYLLWIVALLMSTSAYNEGNQEEGNLLSTLNLWGLVLTVFASGFIARHFTQKHAEEVFHPSIQTVLQELDRPLTESGFEVRLMIENSDGSWLPPSGKSKPMVSFLRFTPLRDEDKDAEAAAMMVV